jgi:transcription elongation factor/antiterminator RfaH
MPDQFAGGRDPGARWCVVYTQPHHELRAKAHLRNQGFAVFLPLSRKTVRHARRFRAVLAPLFPRYLFVEVAVDRDQWSPIRGTYGVAHLIMDGDRPRRVPHGIVESLQELTDDRDVVHFEATLRTGESVRITTGAFAGLVGKLASLDAEGRVQVLLNVLGKDIVAKGTKVGLVPAA